MNVFIWMLAGAFLGYVTFRFFGWSPGRGKVASIMVGGMGGIFGGKLLQPLFVTAPEIPTTDFSLSGLVCALILSVVILMLANVIFNKWEV